MTDRAGLVAFYDSWPGNGAGLFLQPRNPHGAPPPVAGDAADHKIFPYLNQLATFGCCKSNDKQERNEKVLRETQTLRTGCSKAEPKNFRPATDPLPGAWDGQNLVSWRWSLPLPTNPVWRGSMHAISSYRGNRATSPAHHRQDRSQYTAPLASAQCKHYLFVLKPVSRTTAPCRPGPMQDPGLTE